MAIYLKNSESNACAKLEPIGDDLYKITWFDMWDGPSLVLSDTATIHKPWIIPAEILETDHPLAKAMDECEVDYYNDYASDIMLRA